MRALLLASRSGPRLSRALPARRLAACGLTLAILAWAPAVARAQGVRSYEYAEAQGLPSVQVYGVRQLSDGHMLFAGNAGLVTFDGREWQVDESLVGLVPRVRHVALGARDEIWATFDNFGHPFAVRREGVWQTVDAPAAPAGLSQRVLLFEVVADPAGEWLLYGGRESLHALRGGVWQTLATSAGLGGQILGAAWIDGGLVIASRNGLVRWRDGVIERPFDALLAEAGLGGSAAFAVAAEPGAAGHDRLWILGSDWLGCIESGVFHKRCEPLPGLDLELAHELVPDGGGGLLIGSALGLWHFEASAGELLRLRRATRNGTWMGATDLFRDREGVLWVTHERGVHRVPSLRFLNHSQVDGLLDDEVTAIIESPPGRMVFAHPDGLSFLQAGRVSTLALPIDTHHQRRIDSLAADAQGNLWASRSRAGVMRVGVDGSVLHLPAEPKQYVSSVLVDDQQNVWLTQGKSLRRWNGTDFVPLAEQGLDSASLRRVVQLADGRLCLLSHDAGILLRSGSGWQTIRGDERAANNAYDARTLCDGRLLVASEGGLMEVIDGRLRPFVDGEFEFPETVYSIAEDKCGVLWLGTQDGAVRWDGTRRAHLSMAQGLAGHETNRAALRFDSRGRLWIGSVGGVSLYRPELDFQAAAAPLIALRRIRVGSERHPADLDLALGPAENDLEFDFHAVTFAGEGRPDYRFRLRGYDADWVDDSDASDGGHVRYTNLPAGDYRFEVTARNGASPWSATAASAAIRVAAPFWRRWWFLGGALALLASIVWGINNLVHERRRSALLDLQVRARTAKLLATERSYREVFEKSRAPQLLIGREDGRILAANQAAAEFYGAPAADLIGAPFGRCEVPSEDLPSADLCSVEVGQGRQFASAQRVASGAVRQVEIFASAYELDGRRIVQAILHDVTEQKRLQAQLFVAQRMESIGRLAGGIAHDFNNILTIILGNAELALAELAGSAQAPDSLVRGLQQIRESGERAARLTRQLLEFSRRQVVRFEIVDLNAIVRSMEGMARRLTREDIELVLALGPDLEATMAEPSQMEQVLMNLVVNAGDAMPSGGTLTIRTANVERAGSALPARAGHATGRFVMLAVSDTGVGMDAETRRRAFEPFYSRKPMGRGTGLGLATIHGIVEQAGGTIEVESAPGEGSTFSVFLPASDARAEGPVRTPGSPTHLHGSETILICEDDESLRNLATRILSNHGYHILPAALPSRALELAADRTQAIDLLVTDVIMPERNGRELAEAICALRPGLPVLYVSGYTADVIARHGVLEPGIEFLHKPFSALDLLRRVRALADREAGVAARSE